MNRPFLLLIAAGLLITSAALAAKEEPVKPEEFKPAKLTRKATPPPRAMAEVNRILDAGKTGTTAKRRDLNIVLVASKKDHGPETHDYPLWQKRWSTLLSFADNVKVSTAFPWPNEQQFKSAHVIVFYSNNKVLDVPKAKQFRAYLERGGGAVFLHWGVNGARAVDPQAKNIGLVWAKGSRYRHGPLTLKFKVPDHPITKGFKSTHFDDESYWNMTGDANSINVLATTVEEKKPRPLLWTRDVGKGKVFVNILGHNTWTFDDPLYRILVMRGIAWVANDDINRLNKLVTVGTRVN